MRTVLALDVGNAEVKCGVYQDGALCFTCRAATEPRWTGDQYAALLGAQTARFEGTFDGAALSCVVPLLTRPMAEALTRVCGVKPLVVGPGVRTGLDIRIDNPVGMGPDFVCGAVGALAVGDAPVVVFDFGTATTLTAIDARRALVGRLIVAGAQLGLDALAGRTAWLPPLRLEGAGRGFFGRATEDAMEKGALYGNAAMADGLFARCRALLGEDLKCIFTGGCAGRILPHCAAPARLEEHLVLEGLRLIWERNQPRA